MIFRLSSIGLGLVLSFAPAVACSQDDAAGPLDTLLATAQQAQGRGDYRTAAEAYRNAVQLEKQSPELWANLGLMDHQIGNYDESIQSLRTALRLRPSMFAPHLFLGLDYLQTRQLPLALLSLKEAERLDPKDLQAPLALGRAYSLLGNEQLAALAFDRATKLDSRSVPAWMGLGVANLEQVEMGARTLLTEQPSAYRLALLAASLTRERKYVEAVDQYKQAIALPSGPPCLHSALGFVYVHQGAAVEARHEFDVDSTSHPGCGLAVIGLAHLDAEGGADTQAVKALEGLWQQDHGFFRQNISMLFEDLSPARLVALRTSIGDAHAGGDLPEELYDVLSAVGAGTDPSTEGIVLRERLEIHAERAPDRSHVTPEMLFAQGRYGECEANLVGHPTAGRTDRLQLLAACSFLTGDFETSSSASNQLLAAAPGSPAALYWSISSSQRLAVAALARVGAIDPDSPQTHLLLADVYRQREHYDEARAEYEKALQLAPGSPPALMGLTAIYIELSQLDQAIETGEQLLHLDASDPEANLLVAQAYADSHKYDQAASLLAKCQTLRPELQPRVHMLLGTIYAEQNHNEQAITELKLAAASDDDGSIHYKLSRLYRKEGDTRSADEAIEISKKLVQARLLRATTAVQETAVEPGSKP